MKFRVVIEIDVPESELKDDVFTDAFRPEHWGAAMLETACVRMKGTQNHPYRPRVVESYSVPEGLDVKTKAGEVSRTIAPELKEAVREAVRMELGSFLDKMRAIVDRRLNK